MVAIRSSYPTEKWEIYFSYFLTRVLRIYIARGLELAFVFPVDWPCWKQGVMQIWRCFWGEVSARLKTTYLRLLKGLRFRTKGAFVLRGKDQHTCVLRTNQPAGKWLHWGSGQWHVHIHFVNFSTLKLVVVFWFFWLWASMSMIPAFFRWCAREQCRDRWFGFCV